MEKAEDIKSSALIKEVSWKPQRFDCSLCKRQETADEKKKTRKEKPVIKTFENYFRMRGCRIKGKRKQTNKHKKKRKKEGNKKK